MGNISTTNPSATNSESIKDEIKSNILKIIELEKKQKENRTIGEKVSEWIALFAGSMTFVYIHVIWFGAWILANTVAPIKPFDPFPFTFLTLVVSLEAIFLSTFILISQNHETELTNRRNHLDLQINMLAEQENTKTLELLQAIAKKVGVNFEDESMRALLEPVDPEVLLQEILDAEANGNASQNRERRGPRKGHPEAG